MQGVATSAFVYSTGSSRTSSAVSLGKCEKNCACPNAVIVFKAWCTFTHVMIGLFDLASMLIVDSEFPIPKIFSLIKKICECKHRY